MNLSYQLFVAVRYLRSKKKHKGISFNTAIIYRWSCCRCHGVARCTVGYERVQEDLQKKILGANSHAIVLSYTGSIRDYRPLLDKVKEEPAVVNVSPFVLGQVLISAGRMRTVFS